MKTDKKINIEEFLKNENKKFNEELLKAYKANLFLDEKPPGIIPDELKQCIDNIKNQL